MVFSLKRSPAGYFGVPIKVLSRKKNYDRGKCVVLEWLPLRGEKNSNHAQKAGSWYLLRVLFKAGFYLKRSEFEVVLKVT